MLKLMYLTIAYPRIPIDSEPSTIPLQKSILLLFTRSTTIWSLVFSLLQKTKTQINPLKIVYAPCHLTGQWPFRNPTKSSSVFRFKIIQMLQNFAFQPTQQNWGGSRNLLTESRVDPCTTWSREFHFWNCKYQQRWYPSLMEEFSPQRAHQSSKNKENMVSYICNKKEHLKDIKAIQLLNLQGILDQTLPEEM